MDFCLSTAPPTQLALDAYAVCLQQGWSINDAEWYATYTNGLGVHSPSDVRYNLGGNYTTVHKTLTFKNTNWFLPASL